MGTVNKFLEIIQISAWLSPKKSFPSHHPTTFTHLIPFKPTNLPQLKQFFSLQKLFLDYFHPKITSSNYFKAHVKPFSPYTRRLKHPRPPSTSTFSRTLCVHCVLSPSKRTRGQRGFTTRDTTLLFSWPVTQPSPTRPDFGMHVITA